MKLMGASSENTGSFFKRITYTQGIYPELDVQFNGDPNRFFAFPLLGIIIKIVILLPVFIEIIFLAIWLVIVVALINPFVLLFTGKYWTHAYNFSLGFIKLTSKASLYVYGLTDKYPGFDFQTPPGLSLNIPQPANPSKLYAIPLLGFLIRIIFMIPYYFFVNIINQAVTIGVFLLAWAVVLVKGKYPEGIFELARDSVRVNVSATAYVLGLSDRYPSFYISMSHDKIKIILIVLAILMSGWNYSNNYTKKSQNQYDYNNYQYQYKQQLPPEMQDLLNETNMQQSTMDSQQTQEQ